jgi:zinc transporter
MTDENQPFSIAMLLDGKGGARDLSAEEVANWREGDGVLWLDIDLTKKAGKQWLSKEGSLDQSLQSVLLAAETRPRSLVEADSLIVVMRGINMNPGSVPDDMVAVRMALQQNRIISTRRRTVLSVKDIRESLLAGKGPKNSAEFLVAITGCLSNRIESAVENIENMVADLDEQMADRATDEVRTSLGVIRRQAAAIRRHLAPQRDAIDRIARSSTGLLSDRDVFDLREEGDQLTRHIEDLDLARENALVTQEELMNRVALEQNARMYLLSVVAAIFLPLTFITGLLGMNVAGLPGTENPYGFIYSALIMVASLAGLVLYFRSRKWL